MSEEQKQEPSKLQVLYDFHRVKAQIALNDAQRLNALADQIKEKMEKSQNEELANDGVLGVPAPVGWRYRFVMRDGVFSR